ncbi:MAG: UDP-N-acetylmuramate--L-alanine ligase [Spirochaetales bacterium]|nr:UDP-N-acetylmuramate--L-alanine ligase [Spirochaetales bacterium]
MSGTTDRTTVSIRNTHIHMTGIKGTGMAALAEVLADEGAHLTGSDVGDRFYTDALLERIGVAPSVGFAADHVPPGAEVLVYSAAYDETNPERIEATRRSIPQFSYTEMLGALSRTRRSLAVSGVHGKTSTAAMIGAMIAADRTPATVVVGSAVEAFGGSATLRLGNEFLVAETCEYRRHFLDFSPHILLVTGIEVDHQDYFRDLKDVLDAFYEFALRLPDGGTLIYCADDPGATDIALTIADERPALTVRPYGFSVEGVGGVGEPVVESGRQRFSLTLPDVEGAARTAPWSLSVPGRHMVANAAAAIHALAALTGPPDDRRLQRWREALARFSGTRRRSEIVGEAGGVLVMDDYAHHPTAIAATLAGYRAFWPDRRLVVDFMPHTYSRTAALLDAFAGSFAAADRVYLNDIYASARETNHGGIDGMTLFRATRSEHDEVHYRPDFDEAARDITASLRPGDLFVTMGAGDNFRIGAEVLRRLAAREET